MFLLKDKNSEQEKTTTGGAAQAEREKLYKLHFPQSDTTPKIHRLFLRLCQGCVLCSPSDKVHTPLLFLLDGGARRNNLAQCIGCGTGGQVRRENKTSGKLYLERSFSTVRKGPPVPGVFFWDHLVIIFDKGEPRLVIRVQNHPIIYGVSGLI